MLRVLALILCALLVMVWPLSTAAAAPAKKDENGFGTKLQQWEEKMSEKFRDTWKGLRGEDKNSAGTASLDLRESNQEYTVRLNLPNREMQDVNVTVEQQTLKIEAKEQKTTKKDDPAHPLHSSVMAAYSQIITLPGPVQADKMKVDKKEGMLVVTLPKAKQT
jgi:HSP20 family protein